MKKILLLAICCLLLLPSCSGEKTNATVSNAQPSNNEEKIESVESAPDENGKVLLDDECIIVSYIEVFEEPSIEGVFYFRLNVENKTEKTVTIYLIDPAVNAVSTLALSGVPMTIQPGGKSLTPFFFSYSNLDISSIDELEDISFKVKVEDNETFKEIETSDVVSISTF